MFGMLRQLGLSDCKLATVLGFCQTVSHTSGLTPRLPGQSRPLHHRHNYESAFMQSGLWFEASGSTTTLKSIKTVFSSTANDMSATKLMQNVCSRVFNLQRSQRLQSVRAFASSAFSAPATPKHQHQWTSHHPGLPDHQSRSLAAPAVAHHAFTRTPLSTPIVQPSHTTISIPLGSIDLFGNYSIQGPAVIRKVNNTLMALVQPGGVVSVLCNPEGPTLMSSASLSHDEDEAALCHLVGHHLELDGSFIMQDEQHGSMEHGGKTIVSVAHLSDDTCITLLPGGSMSHPVNVQPPLQQRRH